MMPMLQMTPNAVGVLSRCTSLDLLVEIEADAHCAFGHGGNRGSMLGSKYVSSKANVGAVNQFHLEAESPEFQYLLHLAALNCPIKGKPIESLRHRSELVRDTRVNLSGYGSFLLSPRKGAHLGNLGSQSLDTEQAQVTTFVLRIAVPSSLSFSLPYDGHKCPYDRQDRAQCLRKREPIGPVKRISHACPSPFWRES